MKKKKLKIKYITKKNKIIKNNSYIDIEGSL